jgi:dynein heavy chain 2
VEGASLGEKKRQRKLSGGDELLKGFLHIHESCDTITSVATPRRYMAFIHAFNEVYNAKKKGIQDRQLHLNVRFW